MSLKIPYGASLGFMDVIVTDLLQGGTLRLFKNDYTPVNGTVLGDLTEANFDGYAAITVNDWSAAALNADNKAAVAAAIKTWTKAAGATANTIYGVFYKDSLGVFRYAERSPAGGVLIDTEGQFYSYLPRFTFKSEY